MQGKSKLADKASFEIQRLKDQINEEVRKQESFQREIESYKRVNREGKEKI